MPIDNKPKVLAVDDRVENIFALDDILSRINVDLETAESSDEIFAKIKHNDFAVILIDAQIPSINGYDIANQIHAMQGENNHTAIIFITSEPKNQADLYQGYKSGAVDYVFKPLVPEILISKVQIFIELKEKNKTLQFEVKQKEVAEKSLRKLAHYDPLTGLANRLLFTDHLTRAIAKNDRCNKLLSVMFIDLDNFKDVNDSFGHDAGDLLLENVAERLKQVVRTSDIVARFGGDEFAVVLEDLSHANQAAKIAQKILDCLSPTHLIDGHEVIAQPSIGIALHPTCGKNVEALLKSADTAMYSAKKNGKNNFMFFAEGMHQAALARVKLEAELRHAIEHDEFRVFYQAQVDANSEKVIGMEALVRWQHPEKGLISPLDFIPAAEELGHIKAIGKSVLKTACKQASIWNKDKPNAIRVAVNVSVKQLLGKSFWKDVHDVLLECGTDPKHLEIELTESSIMEDSELAIETLVAIRDLGVNIAIDDFGTGYSSLSYLLELPLKMIKIDKSFVFGIGKDPKAETLVKTLITMAHGLNLKVIAEGVESLDHVDFLRLHKCDYLQGYYYSRPLESTSATAFLEKTKNKN